MPAQIRIELPLPIDITGTLINIIGKTWPGTMIKDDGTDWRSERRLVLEIPDEQRHKSPKKAKKYAEVKQHLRAEVDALITELGPNGAGFGIPEYLADILVGMAKIWFTQEPDAKNYIETTVRDPETRHRYVFYVARSEKQTPHALRTQAETELDTVKAERDQYKRELDAVPWECVPKDIYDRAPNDNT
ncbi:hypothetical protein [Mycobacteroides abscessus]|uniref:hypothetical protein n=1 Tax=Mycobacteroides abscessus TaxID=36809 RepID=UPI000927176E|nr:hypothetical protein [Mycobacteroides abscessus]SHY53698.1 Uncharacterised protein [Mycobacteroides abscessus subsp. abscessus]SHY63279.1 Uncharacterised protein [Mycobacteroides abscessus subsp. abscessus]SHY73238.1 Uncharacterised protein [Mycobacteroides abscessus subsp. abscessus]SIA15102.1 Uncharacterised protein [Mycobacteroides abscessus subsp. abscessus]SIB18053.1 Uncharacterised protein [Mycobacteroides abscessus subsp. abscessus]